jgi:hypothetical protein
LTEHRCIFSTADAIRPRNGQQREPIARRWTPLGNVFLKIGGLIVNSNVDL